MGVAYSVVYALDVLDDERLERKDEFMDVADEAVAQLQVRVDSLIGSLAGIGAAAMAFHAEGYGELDINVFTHLARHHLFNLQGLGHGVSFNTHVLRADRPGFEARHDLDQSDFNFTIRQRGEVGLEYAANNSEYHVVTYMEPLAENQGAIGFDLWSVEGRRRALNASR